jgi:glycosyltransferase involved in cell wall biosynthesis
MVKAKKKPATLVKEIPESNLWQERLSIVIPAFNEEGAIEQTLGTLKTHLPKAEIIIIDDGSSDKTAVNAQKIKGIRVLQHNINKGYGAALKSGMHAATRDYVAWFDADNEHSVEDLCTLVEKIDQNNLVAVIGQRERSGPSLVRNIGKWVIKSLGKTLKIDFGNDLNCGLRVFKRDVISRYLKLLPDSYSASMTSLIIMLERGYPIGFSKVTLNQRIGQSKVTLNDGYRAIIIMLRTIMLFAPLRIFMTVGLSLITISVLYSLLIIATVSIGVPVLGATGIIIGVLILLQGLLADQLSQIRLNEIESATENLTQELGTDDNN